ncbi:hypothetical protein A4D02_26510 [Niastella koreensis]|uniref:Lipoprotein n=2 Tax=Niastella koreensis TaxID=354356 RepID=G8TEH0_NIAKG|nr:hypothetical protein [Niastella koreensis]AEV99392.1 hypothetical protein Niako_3062 [Niastella koreensis GR20-10]OQP49996.1 hypothetical protein A4D02_26510 [Niastella koreensis]
MKKILVFLLLLPLLAFKCHRVKNYIEVENQLNQNVFCLPGFNYPDTSLVQFDRHDILANDAVFFVKSAQKQRLFYEYLCVKSAWRQCMAKDTLLVFVIAEKTMRDSSWSSINSNNLYLRRLVYSYDDILNNGSKITIK